MKILFSSMRLREDLRFYSTVAQLSLVVCDTESDTSSDVTSASVCEAETAALSVTEQDSSSTSPPRLSSMCDFDKRSGKLDRDRSRLHRSQTLQVNMH